MFFQNTRIKILYDFESNERFHSASDSSLSLYFYLYRYALVKLSCVSSYERLEYRQVGCRLASSFGEAYFYWNCLFGNHIFIFISNRKGVAKRFQENYEGKKYIEYNSLKLVIEYFSEISKSKSSKIMNMRNFLLWIIELVDPLNCAD